MDKKVFGIISVLTTVLLLVVGCVWFPDGEPDWDKTDPIESSSSAASSSTSDIPDYPGNAAALMETIEQEYKQTFTKDSESWNMITGEKGTDIYIPANSFVKKDGSPVIGNVEVELKELFDKASLVLNDKPTEAESGGEIVPLVTGGVINISASQNGEELVLASNRSISIEMPASNFSTNMQLFIGVTNGSNFVWQLLPTPIWPAMTNGAPSYYFNLTNLGWINCDYFRSFPEPKEILCFNVPPGFGIENTKIDIIFSDMAMVAGAYYDYANDRFHSRYAIPTGLNITIAAIADIDGVTQTCFLTGIVTQVDCYDLVFTPMSKEDYQAQLMILCGDL